MVYFPRRSFDLWGARYFLLPASPDWSSPDRGIASFLDQTELVYPEADLLLTSGNPGKGGSHGVCATTGSFAATWPPTRAPGSSTPPRSARLPPTRTPAPSGSGHFIYMNDPIWSERGQPVLDLRQTALIETDDKESLRGFLSRTAVGPRSRWWSSSTSRSGWSSRPRWSGPDSLSWPTPIIPGWRLTIDGKTAPIFRANRMMRGAAVPAGEHTLVYTYEPVSFRIGAIVSLAGAMVLLILGCSSPFRRLTMRSAATSDQV